MTSFILHYILELVKKFKKADFKRFFNIGSYILILIALAVTVVFVQQRQNTQQQAEETARFNVFSELKTTPKNRALNVVTAVNSEKHPIYSVLVKLTYPTEKLELIGVDTKNSDFPYESEKILGAGLIFLGRSTRGAVSGQKYVGTVQFKTKEATDISEIKILPESQIISSVSNENIFKGTAVVDSVEIKDRAGTSILNRFLASNEALWKWVFENFLPGIVTVFQR